MEVWNIITDYPDYEVSSLGRVKSNRRKRARILTCNTDSYGYRCVTLQGADKTIKRFRVHRLVACAFHPIVIGKDIVNHLDGVKTNNSSNNLEWCTQKENSEHAWLTGLTKGHDTYSFGKSHSCFKGIIIMEDKTGVTVANFAGTKEITNYGFNPAHVYAVVSGTRKTHKGYKFRRLLCDKETS